MQADPVQAEQSRRRRWIAIACAIAAVELVVLVVVVSSVVQGGSGDSASPASVVPAGGGTTTSLVEPDWQPPDAFTAKLTVATLDGPAKPAVQVGERARLLAEDPTPTSCATTETAVAAVADPTTFTLAAGAIPDPVLRDLYLSLRPGIEDVLTACSSSGADLAARQAALRDTLRFAGLRTTALQEAAR